MKTTYYHIFQKSLMLLWACTFLCIIVGCKSELTSTHTNTLKKQSLIIASDQSYIPNLEIIAEGKLQGYEYRLNSGDEVEIKFFYTPELNEIQTIRPDGMISLQIIGELKATGKTPAQLKKDLVVLYSDQLQKPEISVVVRTFSNRRVFVGGQVMRPGVIEMRGNLTALEAISEAGGVDFREAETHNIVVIRHYMGKRTGYLLDISSALKGEETKPFFLKPQDIVFVPRTQIAKINQWIDQHINKIIPQTGFFVSRRIGESTIGIDTSER